MASDDTRGKGREGRGEGEMGRRRRKRSRYHPLAEPPSPLLTYPASSSSSTSSSEVKVLPRPSGEELHDRLVSLAKRRGFVFPSSSIYGGESGFFDYGPLGISYSCSSSPSSCTSLLLFLTESLSSQLLIPSRRPAKEEHSRLVVAALR